MLTQQTLHTRQTARVLPPIIIGRSESLRHRSPLGRCGHIPRDE